MYVLAKYREIKAGLIYNYSYLNSFFHRLQRIFRDYSVLQESRHSNGL